MLVGILVVLGLIVASGSLVSVMNGGLLAISGDSAANQAQAVAESGADQIISVLNQPENRKLLVSGDVAPTTTNWTTSNESLRSPCISTRNERPGGNGYPSTTAVTLADGNFRNLANISQTDQGDRRFALKAVRYSTGANASTDRRTIYRTYQVGTATPFPSGGNVPTGKSFSDLVNLSDPDASDPLITAGSNSGLIAITVEGRTYRNGVQVGTATVTKEYEVLPKCCGGSFGSNGSGGKNVSTNSLGSDSRFCGVEFGMIVGLNQGKLWSYYSNDRYTKRNENNEVVNVQNLLGIVEADGDPFNRAGTNFPGCRVIPGECSTNQKYATSGDSDGAMYPTLFSGFSYSCTLCGSDSDKAGTSASGIPIVPLYLPNGLPTVASRYAVSWTTDGRPATRIAVSNNNGYPSFTSSATTKLLLRTRNDTSRPRVEFCDATYATCSSTTSPFNSWAQVSTAGTLTIGDDFRDNTFSGSTSNLPCIEALNVQCNVNRWATPWEENDTATGGAGVGAGNVRVESGTAILRNVNGEQSTPTNRAAIARVVNLHALQSPYLSFTQTVTGLTDGEPTLEVSYSRSNASINSESTTDWTQLMTTKAKGELTGGSNASCTLVSAITYTCRVKLNAAQTGYTKIRFRAHADFSASQSVAIRNVGITSVSSGGKDVAASYDDWCEYNSSFPSTALFTGGFHCLGPSLNFVNGGTFIVDSSGGSLSFYYNDTNDKRGQSVSSPVINMAGGASLQHVNCNPNIPPNLTVPFTPSENCQTPIPENKFSAVGDPDMFNIFGRDSSPDPSNLTMQWVRIGSFSTNVTTPGKIAGAWFYMPWGGLYLVAEQCDDDPENPKPLPTDFYTNDNNWNFGGRLWMRYFVPCGANYFRVPPSSATNLDAFAGTVSLGSASGNLVFVSWTGVDWVARAAISSRINSSL